MPCIPEKPHTQFYDEYKQSDEWRLVCEERRRYDGYRCVCCGKPALLCREGLQVHHLTYENLGHEDIKHDIVSMCGKCHIKFHKHDAVTMRRAYRAAGWTVNGDDDDYIGRSAAE